MGDPHNWPPLEGGRRHPDDRLRHAALGGLLTGLALGFAVAWLWL